MCELCKQTGGADRAQPSRRRFLTSMGTIATGFVLAHGAWAEDIKAPPKPQNVVSPDGALELLEKGNARYVGGVSKRHDFQQEREALVSGQNPYAGIFSCADSRIASEYAFDSGRGDLFAGRVAGNFANDDTIASFEYAVANLGTPLIMLLGHDSCGAVSATLPGHLPWLVANLASAAKAGAEQPGDPLANAIRQNVINNVAALKSATPILDAAVSQKKLKIVDAIYGLADGRVEMVA